MPHASRSTAPRLIAVRCGVSILFLRAVRCGVVDLSPLSGAVLRDTRDTVPLQRECAFFLPSFLVTVLLLVQKNQLLTPYLMDGSSISGSASMKVVQIDGWRVLVRLLCHFLGGNLQFRCFDCHFRSKSEHQGGQGARASHGAIIELNEISKSRTRSVLV